MRTSFAVVAWACVSLLGCASASPAARCPEPAAVETTQAPRSADGEASASAERGAPTRVFIVRHAEKANDGTQDPPLLPEGAARAECLARTLGDVAFTHAFATDLQRTALTLQPLAAAKGLEVEVLPASNIEELATRLRGLPPGSTVAVAGHSNSIPHLVELLGVQLPGLSNKGHIPDGEHDRLIEVVISSDESPTSLAQLRYCAPS